MSAVCSDVLSGVIMSAQWLSATALDGEAVSIMLPSGQQEGGAIADTAGATMKMATVRNAKKVRRMFKSICMLL